MDFGDFVWFDLVTNDAEAAADFYAELVGWDVSTNPMGEMGTYTMFSVDGKSVGGIAPQPPPEGAPSHWLGYVAVEDADATAERAKELGGAVLSEAIAIPDVGRFYVMSGPENGVFAAFQPENIAEMPDVDPAEPGIFGWFELYTNDAKASVDFYTELLGWELGEAMEMEGGEVYQLFNNGESDMGGIFDVSGMGEQAPPSHWNHYVRVADLDATAEKVTADGGNILHGPMEVPGGARVFIAMDPWGAVISFSGS